MIDPHAVRRGNADDRHQPHGVAYDLRACSPIVTSSFWTKTECISLCVPGSRFTHKATNSGINSITSIYYIVSYYKTYYKSRKD
jgi:hypothetical protein